VDPKRETGVTVDPQPPPTKKRRSRFSDVPVTTAPANSGSGAPGVGALNVATPCGTTEARGLDLQARIAAKLAKGKSTGSDGAAIPTSATTLLGTIPSSLSAVATGSVVPWTREASYGLAMDRVPLGRGSIDLESIPVQPVNSLRINASNEREKKLKQGLKKEKADLDAAKDPERNPYFDERIRAGHSRLARKTFRFVEEGSVVAKAERVRERTEHERIREELRENEAKAEREAPVLALAKEDEIDEVPVVEWWDEPVLDGNDYNRIREERVTEYIHHPIPTKATKPEQEPRPIQLMLTSKERKRMRRQRRADQQREEQQMVQMGLTAPKPNKVKLSNLVRVLSTEISQDPTKVEAEVRQQVEARHRAHVEANQARKASAETRAQKWTARLRADVERGGGVHCAVFRLGPIEDPQTRFKLDRCAEANQLTGVVILHRPCNVLVAEGGPKALGRLKRLVLRRIEWAPTSSVAPAPAGVATVPSGGEALSALSTAPTKTSTITPPTSIAPVALTWEGILPRPTFRGFKIVTIPSGEAVRIFFRKRKVEHYWDACVTLAPNPSGQVPPGNSEPLLHNQPIDVPPVNADSHANSI